MTAVPPPFVPMTSVDAAAVESRLKFLLGSFGISDDVAFRRVLGAVGGNVISPNMCWAMYPSYTACVKQKKLYIWIQNELCFLLQLVAFFIAGPGYNWPVERTDWSTVAVDPVADSNRRTAKTLHIPLLPKSDVSRCATRVFVCKHPNRKGRAVYFLLCQEYLDPSHLASCFLLNRVQCYYGAKGLYVPRVASPHTSPTRLRRAAEATFQEWMDCAEVVESACDRSICASEWARNIYLSVSETPPHTLLAAKKWVERWNAVCLFYVPQLRLSRCPSDPHMYLVVLPICAWSAHTQHSRFYIFWEHATASLQSMRSSDACDVRSTRHEWRWHRIPLMRITDAAHPLSFLSHTIRAESVNSPSELPERCFSVIEQEEYSLDTFLKTHLQSVVFLVGNVATGYPVSLSQDAEYHLYRHEHLNVVAPEPFESLTRLCLHGTFYVHTGQLCVALTRSRYLKIVPTSVEWPDATRLNDFAANNEQRVHVTVSTVVPLVPTWDEYTLEESECEPGLATGHERLADDGTE